MKKVSPEEKALQYLALGRVDVLWVHRERREASVNVQSGSMDGDPYSVEFYGDEWHCDCPARVLDCVHIRAVRKVVHFASQKPTLHTQSDDTGWVDSLLGSGK